jgi:hypothetical protein
MKAIIIKIEKAGGFEPKSAFDEANGAVSFNLFTDEIFNVGDSFVDGELVKCEAYLKSKGLWK